MWRRHLAPRWPNRFGQLWGISGQLGKQLSWDEHDKLLLFHLDSPSRLVSSLTSSTELVLLVAQSSIGCGPSCFLAAVAPTPTPYSYVWRAGSRRRRPPTTRSPPRAVSARRSACRGFAYVGNNCSTSAQLTVFKTAEGFGPATPAPSAGARGSRLASSRAGHGGAGRCGRARAVASCGHLDSAGPERGVGPVGARVLIHPCPRRPQPLWHAFGRRHCRLQRRQELRPIRRERGRGSDKSGGGGLDASEAESWVREEAEDWVRAEAVTRALSVAWSRASLLDSPSRLRTRPSHRTHAPPQAERGRPSRRRDW